MKVRAAMLGFAVLCLTAPIPGQSAAAMPDLMVTVLLQKVKENGQWYVRMGFRVKNVGAAPAGPSTVGAFCRPTVGGPCPSLDGNYDVGPPVVAGGTGVIRLPTPAIPAGGFVMVVGPRTKAWLNGTYRVTARADTLAAVAEVNEANNSAHAEITIP